MRTPMSSWRNIWNRRNGPTGGWPPSSRVSSSRWHAPCASGWKHAGSSTEAGNERRKVIHPERLILTHLGFYDGRSGQERETLLLRLPALPGLLDVLPCRN